MYTGSERKFERERQEVLYLLTSFSLDNTKRYLGERRNKRRIIGESFFVRVFLRAYSLFLCSSVHISLLARVSL